MDRNIIKYTFLLSILIFHYGQLTKGSSADCTLDQNVCGEDEYCEEGYMFARCVKRSQIPEYGDYRPNDERNDYIDQGYDFNSRRGEIPEGKQSFDENGYDSSEPTLEDKALIQSLPLEGKSEGYESDTRGAHGPVLPPIEPVNWDGVELRNDISIRNRGQPSADERHNFESSRELDSPQRENHAGPHRTFHEDVANEQISIEHLPQEKTNSESENTKDTKSNDNVTPDKKDKSQDKPIHSSHFQSSDNTNVDIDSKGKVMIKGEVKKAEANIDQGPNPEGNYERIKDFFKSQQASSIVEVPNAVKREEASKISKKNFVQVNKNVKDEVNAEEADDNRASKKSLKIKVDKKVDKSSVHVRTVKNDYSSENENDIAKRINADTSVKDAVARQMGMNILKADQDSPSKFETKTKHVVNQHPKYFLTTLIVVGCVSGVILSAVAVYLIMKRYNDTKKFKPVTLPGQEAAADYQELCRQFRASQGWEAPVKPGGHTEKDKSLLGSAKPPAYSWSEEPVVPNMDISTGHVVLAYMEDHLNNKDRLNKEWEALCTYEAEPNATELGKQDKNVRKNRYSDVLPYDHNRAVLRETANASGSDYVNASFITDHDPRNPAYIATQGPLAHTVSDFWQMVWEQGVIVIVNLTRLSDLGLPQCHRYWPEEGHETYHIYEVHLVSEHIWCDDYLVRSFYLKNLQTSETRTVTQFHFLSWPDLNVPTSPKPLLEFRRKVNKCFRGRSCPIVVHCSGGVGRTGCYILIDMVLNKMMRGAKEIDIAATVEHLRDQRPHMVKTKAQFEFALTAVAEEVNAILQALAK